MPLSENMELKTPEKKEWELLPEDVYQMQVTDISEEEGEWKGEKKQQMKFEFTVIQDGASYGRKLWLRMTPCRPVPAGSTGKPSWIWRIASAIAGHPLTKEEGEQYDIARINALIGKQLRATVNVSEVKPNGKQYNNIQSFLVVKTQLPPFDEAKVPKENQPQTAAQQVAATAAAVDDFFADAPQPQPSAYEEPDVSGIPL